MWRIVFHLALVLAISTVTDSQITVLAFRPVMIVGADLVSGLVPFAFQVLPWPLGPIDGAFLAEAVLVTAGPIPASAGWAAYCWWSPWPGCNEPDFDRLWRISRSVIRSR